MSNDQERSGDENRRAWLRFRDARNGEEFWWDAHSIVGIRQISSTESMISLFFNAPAYVLGDAETVLKRVQEAQAS